jgi:hypothetical protein
MTEEFLVTEQECNRGATRGSTTCFYCHQPLGEPHKDCVFVNKNVTYDVFVEGKKVGTFARPDPAHWTEWDCNFHKNESSWCSDNALDVIVWTDEEARKRVEAVCSNNTCSCSLLEFRYT